LESLFSPNDKLDLRASVVLLTRNPERFRERALTSPAIPRFGCSVATSCCAPFFVQAGEEFAGTVHEFEDGMVLGSEIEHDGQLKLGFQFCQ
jgi:hypothetical protein